MVSLSVSLSSVSLNLSLSRPLFLCDKAAVETVLKIHRGEAAGDIITPCVVLSCLCLVLSCLVFVLFCLVLSCLCLVVSCLVLSCLVLSCLVLSLTLPLSLPCPVFSYHCLVLVYALPYLCLALVYALSYFCLCRRHTRLYARPRRSQRGSVFLAALFCSVLPFKTACHVVSFMCCLFWLFSF